MEVFKTAIYIFQFLSYLKWHPIDKHRLPDIPADTVPNAKSVDWGNILLKGEGLGLRATGRAGKLLSDESQASILHIINLIRTVSPEGWRHDEGRWGWC